MSSKLVPSRQSNPLTVIEPSSILSIGKTAAAIGFGLWGDLNANVPTLLLPSTDN